jgi:hypothetical protein
MDAFLYLGIPFKLGKMCLVVYFELDFHCANSVIHFLLWGIQLWSKTLSVVSL